MHRGLSPPQSGGMKKRQRFGPDTSGPKVRQECPTSCEAAPTRSPPRTLAKSLSFCAPSVAVLMAHAGL